MESGLQAARRKICIVNPFEHGGGAEYQIRLLIEALVARGSFDVSYVTHFVDARERARDYRVVKVGADGPIPRLGYLMEAPALYQALRRLSPDAIYQRVACSFTAVCALYANRHRIPMTWHVAHDTDVMPGQLDPGRNLLRLKLEKWAVGYGARHASRIVVQSEEQRSLLARHYAREASAVVANFHPPALEPLDKSGPLTVVWIANLKPWKRPEVFVRLARALTELAGVEMLMVGAPSEGAANRAWQARLLEDIAATPNLRFIGHQTHEQVNALLARSHVFVNTSTQEGFPNTFIQSWLRDVAVASLSVDPDGILERRRVGIRAGTEAALADGVRRLLTDTQAREGYAARGRRYASERHSLANARTLIDLIDAPLTA